MNSRSPLFLRSLLVALLLSFTPACERDAPDSPPLTVGTIPDRSAPATDEEQQEDEVDASEQEQDHFEHDDQAVPSTPLPEGTSEQQEVMMRARTAFLTDDYELAEELFMELSTSEPVTGTTISAAIALAQIFVETGRPERALELMDRVRENVDDLPEILLVIARVYSDLDRPGEALQTYDQAFQKQPNFIFILTEMAEILMAGGEEDRAGQLLIRYERQLQEMATTLTNTEQTSPELRLYLVDIFSMLHDELAHETLIAALGDPHPQVRQYAAKALGDAGVVEAREDLRRLAIDDESELVRPVAREALNQLE